MRKKSNIIKRNSGFVVACVIAAGVSGFAANLVMTRGLSVLVQETEGLEEQTEQLTVSQETDETRVFETDPFTVTASGNIMKGVEKEQETESETESDTERESERNETQTEAGSQSEATGASGSGQSDDNEMADSNSSGNSAGNTSSDGSYGGTPDGSESGGSGNNGSESSGSGNSGSGDGTWSGSSNGGSSVSGPVIEIYDTGNGSYYYTDDSYNYGNTGSTGSTVYTDFWSDSIFPETYSRYIDESELYIFNKRELRLIRNEIFARHGRIFSASDLASYFAGKAWYVPTYSPEEFDANMDSYLNDYEKANLKVILKYEDALAGN
jgi:hypothetical protein